MQCRRHFLTQTLLCAIALTTILATGPKAMAQEPYIGEIRMVGFNFAQRGWVKCDGQLLQIADNTALFSLIGTTYGGDGRTTFGVPDLRGRVPMHQGNGPGLTDRIWGEKSGSETVTLTVQNMPSHSHAANATISATSSNGNSTDPVDHIHANDPREKQYSDITTNTVMNAAAASVAIGNTGNNTAHENMPPYTTVNFVIATVETYPSRN